MKNSVEAAVQIMKLLAEAAVQIMNLSAEAAVQIMNLSAAAAIACQKRSFPAGFLDCWSLVHQRAKNFAEIVPRISNLLLAAVTVFRRIVQDLAETAAA